MFRFLAVNLDGNTIGLGSLSAALVAALGYMLRDRRDSDTRVDRATTIIVDTIKAERDRAIADNERLRARVDELVEERDDLRERNRIQQFRLGVKENE